MSCVYRSKQSVFANPQCILQYDPKDHAEPLSKNNTHHHFYLWASQTAGLDNSYLSCHYSTKCFCRHCLRLVKLGGKDKRYRKRLQYSQHRDKYTFCMHRIYWNFFSYQKFSTQEFIFNTIYCDRANLSHVVSASRFELAEGVRICSDNRHCRLYCRTVHNGANPIGARKELCNMRSLFCNIRINVSRDGHYERWGIGRKLEGYLSS